MVVRPTVVRPIAPQLHGLELTLTATYHLHDALIERNPMISRQRVLNRSVSRGCMSESEEEEG